MQILSAKPVVEELKRDLLKRTEEFRTQYKRPPKLAVVLVGEDPASVIYTTKKGKAALELGFAHETVKLLATATPAEVRARVQTLNADPTVDGILIQRPLPRGFAEEDVMVWIAPEKDVDAFHPENVGRLLLGIPRFVSCTPAGILELLSFYKIAPAGKLACVVGRSSIVGKPMAALLLQANATVIQCHSKTPNLRSLTTQADLLVVAAGKCGLIDGSYVKPGATVIDVGIHRTPDSKLCGDVVYDDAAKKAGALTPVPGGVGPMTIVMLMESTLRAAERRESTA